MDARRQHRSITATGSGHAANTRERDDGSLVGGADWRIAGADQNMATAATTTTAVRTMSAAAGRARVGCTVGTGRLQQHTTQRSGTCREPRHDAGWTEGTDC